jgi:hypothetical protein
MGACHHQAMHPQLALPGSQGMAGIEGPGTWLWVCRAGAVAVVLATGHTFGQQRCAGARAAARWGAVQRQWQLIGCLA